MSLPSPKKPTSRWWNKLTVKKDTSPRQKNSSSMGKASSLPKIERNKVASSPKKTSWWSRRLFFIIVFLLVIWWIYRESLTSFVKNPNIDTGQTISGANTLFVGKDILVQGPIERNSNKKYSYTHILQDSTYGKIWLRSSTINLYGLSGDISLAGKIVDFTNNMYILEVASIVTPEDEISWGTVLYFNKPGLLLQNMTQDGFVITENTSTQSVNIINPLTKANINLRYFVCGKDKTYNCSEFVKSFKNTSGTQSVDSYDNIFYKLNDENTWFANIDDRYGIYIETSNPQLFSFIIEKSQFITLTWVKEFLTPKAIEYCKQWDKRLQNITTGSLVQNKTGFVWNITGTDTQANAISCVLQFIPNDLEKSIVATIGQEKNQIQNVEQPNLSWTDEVKKDPISIPGDWSTSLPTASVKQFPLRPGKELLFSTQGMTITFPSPNISFSSLNTTQWPEWLQCSARTNVIEYAKKDKLMTEPSVSLYFCKWNLSSLPSNIRKISLNGMMILVQVNDASWTDFANAIIIQ